MMKNKTLGILLSILWGSVFAAAEGLVSLDWGRPAYAIGVVLVTFALYALVSWHCLFKDFLDILKTRVYFSSFTKSVFAGAIAALILLVVVHFANNDLSHGGELRLPMLGYGLITIVISGMLLGSIFNPRERSDTDKNDEGS